MSRRVAQEELSRLRLLSQRISGGQSASPVDTVRWMVAMQGQDLPGVKWSVGLRTTDCGIEDVNAAFDRGDIVRSWPLRGTLHVVAAEDLGWILALTGSRQLAAMATRRRQLDLDDAIIARAHDVARQALRAGARRTRAELCADFTAAGIDVSGQRGYHLIVHLAVSGVLCWGPPAGPEQALVLVEDWIRQPRTPPADQALGELLYRYLASHGPAKLTDFTWWTKLALRSARAGLEAIRDRLTELVVDGETYWTAVDGPAADPAAAATNRVFALPGFDEYLLGYADRGAMLRPDHAPRIVPGGNGVFQPTVVAGGRVAGTWRRRISKDRVVITPELFAGTRTVGKARWEAAAREYARFLGLEPVVG